MKTYFDVSMFTWNGVFKYPMEICKNAMGIFTSLEKAEDTIKNLKNNSYYSEYFSEDADFPDEMSHISHFEIIEKEHDSCCSDYLTVRYYNIEGAFYGGRLVPEETQFRGRNPEDCKYKPGDIVELIGNDCITPVIIVGMPYTAKWYEEMLSKESIFSREDIEKIYAQGDDVYCVFLPYDDGHDHPKEYNLRPVRTKIPENIELFLEARYEALSCDNRPLESENTKQYPVIQEHGLRLCRFDTAELFQEWLSANISRFNVIPEKINLLTYRFKGLIRDVEFIVRAEEINIEVKCQNSHWDFPVWIFCQVKKNGDKYQNASLETPVDHDTVNDVLSGMFEEFLTFVNTTIKPENYLVFECRKDSFYSAKIVKPDKLAEAVQSELLIGLMKLERMRKD